MTSTLEILCIGSVLWDIIGRSSSHMRQGSDVPGRIIRVPGGVALNIAMTLRRQGMIPALLSAVGNDPAGQELLADCRRRGLITDHIYLSEDLPTDIYMAVEGANGLIAAIADAHSLEEAGDKILRPLTDGTLGSAGAPYGGFIALDGNLTEALLAQIAVDPVFQQADMRVAPASPGKATRLLPLVEAGNATLYVNLEEAGLLCQTEFPDAAAAADGMVTRGAKRALVTDGGRASADGSAEGIITRQPPEVLVTRVTGAGDSFMAAHIVAEARGADREVALMAAQAAAAAHVSGETPYD